MYSVVQIFEGAGSSAADSPEVQASIGNLCGAAGFVTLLAIKGDDGALVTVEIFETLDDLRVAQAGASRADQLPARQGRPSAARTISGEIVFQRGL